MCLLLLPAPEKSTHLHPHLQPWPLLPSFSFSQEFHLQQEELFLFLFCFFRVLGAHSTWAQLPAGNNSVTFPVCSPRFSLRNLGIAARLRRFHLPLFCSWGREGRREIKTSPRGGNSICCQLGNLIFPNWGVWYSQCPTAGNCSCWQFWAWFPWRRKPKVGFTTWREPGLGICSLAGKLFLFPRFPSCSQWSKNGDEQRDGGKGWEGWECSAWTGGALGWALNESSKPGLRQELNPF